MASGEKRRRGGLWIFCYGFIFLTAFGLIRAALVYDLQPDGVPDAITRLQLNMEDVADDKDLLTASSFSLCLWFSLNYFNHVGGALLSYAYSDQDSEVINFWVGNDRTEASYQYKSIFMERSITPLWWHSICLVVDPDGLTLYVDNETIYKPVQNKPLHLSGSLVLGQDQDGFDKGYAAHQAFIGKVTGLTFWTSALQPGSVQEWRDCGDVKVLPLFTWASVTFNIYGNFTMEEIEFCSSRTGLNENNLFIFPGQKRWQEVYDILKNMELEFVVPKNEEEVQILSKLLGEHSDYCKSLVYDYKSIWLGLRCQRKGGSFLDVNTNQNISFAMWDQKSLMKMENGLGNDCHAAQDESFTWHTEFEMTKLCYGGVRTSGAMYNLLGLEDLESRRCKNITFVLAGYKDNELYFHSGCGFWIWRNGTGQWRLYDSINKRNIANLYEEKDLPFGVQNWVFVKGGSEAERKLTFSFCREFTCTDGSCIPQIHRCDGTNNCTDGRDERNCHTTSKAVNQSLASPPPELFLDVHIRLNRIVNIDLLGMKFDVDFSVQLEWLDQRLKYHNLIVHKRNILTFTDDSSSEQLWSPSVVVTNSLKAEVDYKEIPNIYCKGQGRRNGEDTEYSGYEASLKVQLRFQTSVYCRFDLRYFPFDEQNCSLVIEIANVEGYNVRYNGTSLAEYDKDAALTNYLLREVHFIASNKSNVCRTDIILYQMADYYIWAIYLPTLLMGFIGYCTLFLPAESFPERGGISLTTLLVLISLYSESSSNFPKTTYLKLIEVWFVFLIVFLSCIITLHLATCNASRDDQAVEFLFGKRPEWVGASRGRVKTCVGNKYKAHCLVLARYLFGGVFAVFVLVYVNIK